MKTKMQTGLFGIIADRKLSGNCLSNILIHLILFNNSMKIVNDYLKKQLYCGIIILLDVALLCHWLYEKEAYNGRKEKRLKRTHIA